MRDLRRSPAPTAPGELSEACLPVEALASTVILLVADPPLRTYERVHADKYFAVYRHVERDGVVLLQLGRPDGSEQWWLVSFRRSHAQAEKQPAGTSV
jgi:hypothetical protein